MPATTNTVLDLFDYHGTTFHIRQGENGDATAEGAILLQRVQNDLSSAAKAESKARKDYRECKITGKQYTSAVKAAVDSIENGRKALKALPAGTSCAGGLGNMTKQTVWCQHFNGVDENLKANMTKKDAKAINDSAMG